MYSRYQFLLFTGTGGVHVLFYTAYMYIMPNSYSLIVMTKCFVCSKGLKYFIYKVKLGLVGLTMLRVLLRYTKVLG